MNAHPITNPAIPTMTSLELVAIINSYREENRAELRHDNFMVKIENHPGIDSPKFLGQYKDSTGRTLKCYHLPKRESELMVMSESLAVQTRVYDRMTELEQRLQLGSAPEPKATSNTEAFRLVPMVVRAARALGLDRNAAAISANQVVTKMTGTNVMQLLGQVHLESERQELVFTSTELGERIGVSGRKFNMLLAEAGLQAKKGEYWMPLPAAEDFCRVMDSSKRHGDGTMIQQLKWADTVLKLIKPELAA